MSVEGCIEFGSWTKEGKSMNRWGSTSCGLSLLE